MPLDSSKTPSTIVPLKEAVEEEIQQTVPVSAKTKTHETMDALNHLERKARRESKNPAKRQKKNCKF